MKIRKAKEEDLKDIIRLYESSSLIKITKEMINERRNKGHIIVAVEKNKIVGFLQSEINVDMTTNQCVDRVSLLISPEHLGQGVGARLLESERKYAAKKKVNILMIDNAYQ